MERATAGLDDRDVGGGRAECGGDEHLHAVEHGGLVGPGVQQREVHTDVGVHSAAADEEGRLGQVPGLEVEFGVGAGLDQGHQAEAVGVGAVAGEELGDFGEPFREMLWGEVHRTVGDVPLYEDGAAVGGDIPYLSRGEYRPGVARQAETHTGDHRVPRSFHRALLKLIIAVMTTT
ncbi:hypothetical protein [Streptomyces sp. NBRC 110028]|uniref:hypothetical protein n=1 Tax=Streptomyces sp. NBRC 110028 TaxID=1621260 RepID=UPI0006E3B5FD|nr:hypothetical protein [Streptomyces sp. NBRC 110028]